MTYKSNIPLIEAIEERSGDDVIDHLIASVENINARDHNGVPAIVMAIKKWDLRSFRKLLENGADPNICDHAGNTPLSLCCVFRDQEFVKLLIKYGADVDGSMQPATTPPLIQAVQSDSKIAHTLLRAGANPNVYHAATGDSPLHLAITKKDTPLVMDLIQRGANVAAQSNIGRTPLHCSIYPLEFLVVARTLVDYTLRRGQDINLVDNKGQTALHLACLGGSNEMISMLIDNGADVNARNIYSKTPAEYALLYPMPRRASKLEMFELKRIFMYHMIALHTADLYLSVDNENLCTKMMRASAARPARRQFWVECQDQCVKEVSELKRTIIPGAGDLSWYDVLTTTDTGHLKYSVPAMNRTVINSFPIYGQMLRVKLYKDSAKARYRSVIDLLYAYLNRTASERGITLPPEIVIKIMSYLSHEDLRPFLGDFRLGIDLCDG